MFFSQGLLIAALFSALVVTLVFAIRTDLAFYLLIVLWMTRFALPLGIASPFGEGNADLPVYEVMLPLLGLCLVFRKAKPQQMVSHTPLRIPMFLWFTLIGLTYLRNPLFLSDLLSPGGTGAVYHTVYPLFLGFIFYMSAANILNTEARIISATKIMFAVMIVGLAAMTLMLVTGASIPFITGGRGPWSIGATVHEEGTVYRIMAMSAYSAWLLLGLLCFGTNLSGPVQLFLAVLLIPSLILGGGRTWVLGTAIYLLVSFTVQPQTRRLVRTLVLLLIGAISLIALFDIDLPHTTQRVTDLSSESNIGIGGRVRMTRTSWDLIKKRPFLGYGYGQVQKQEAEISKEMASGNLHSGFLSVTTATGLVGLAVFLWLLLTAIRTAWILHKSLEDGFLKRLMLWIAINLCASLVTFFVSVEVEKDMMLYFQMGIVSSVYVMCTREDLTCHGFDIEQQLRLTQFGSLTLRPQA